MNCENCKHMRTTTPNRLRSITFVSCDKGIWGRKIQDPVTPIEESAVNCKHYNSAIEPTYITVYDISGN